MTAAKRASCTHAGKVAPGPPLEVQQVAAPGPQFLQGDDINVPALAAVLEALGLRPVKGRDGRPVRRPNFFGRSVGFARMF